MDSPSCSSPQPSNDWSSDDDPAATELRLEADAYSETPQSFLTAAAAGGATSKGGTPAADADADTQQKHLQQQQHSPAQADEAGFVPLDELPTFEGPGEAAEQHARGVAGGAAAAAAMTVLQHAAAEAAAAAAGDASPSSASAGHNSQAALQHEHATQNGIMMQVDSWQESMQAADGHNTSSTNSTASAAAAAARLGWQDSLQYHHQAAAPGLNPVPLLVMPHISEPQAAALRAALQQHDDEQLLEDAAAVGDNTGGSRDYADAAAAAAASGLLPPADISGEGWVDSTAAASQLEQLDLQDSQQQEQEQEQWQQWQQQQHHHEPQQQPWQQQQQYQDFAGHTHGGGRDNGSVSSGCSRLQAVLPQSGREQLDLDDILNQHQQHHQSCGAAGNPMDMDVGAEAAVGGGGGGGGGVDIPVLQQPHKSELRDVKAADVIRPQLPSQQQHLQQRPAAASVMATPQQVIDGDGGCDDDDSTQPPKGQAGAAAAAAQEGLGPQDFGLPPEAPPVIPDEPMRLLHMPDSNPADSYIL